MEERKTVSYKTIDEYQDMLNRKYRGTLVDVYIRNKSCLDRAPLDIEIGWGSPMPTTVEETEKFVNLLQTAIEDAKNFPYKGYIVKVR